jgi:hypothetical protein
MYIETLLLTPFTAFSPQQRRFLTHSVGGPLGETIGRKLVAKISKLGQ